MDENHLPPTLTIAIVAAFSVMGAITYVSVQPYQGWRRALVWSMVGSFCGFCLTWAVCDYLALNTIRYQIVVAFIFGLLGNILCRASVVTVEKHAVNILVSALKRVFRINGDGPSPGNNRDDQP